ncbi:GumC family protein [Gellertiella hungarica]|uniref:Uncharacterized protein involved in exopolysaccharide biosynthesis n=1 Tax=Gellertiella hungarica TaxID=1572859 RepID=A0A7W6J836_9HYPH|nr:GumC family protein [Gellertiella hungarica]MBB4066540.1 uncharacterized protein involved in exopolysaccharide biosynthesis [Gellertiella hungarica]
MVDRQDMMDGRLFDTRPFQIQKGLLLSIWRHRLLFLAVLFGSVLLAVIASLVIPARYLATGMVIVAEADPATRTSDVWAQKQGDPADLESQIMILRSSRLMKLALAQPGAYEAAIAECEKAGDACATMERDSVQLMEKIAERYSVGAVGRSRVLSISYNSALADTAMTMANALVTAYLDDQRGTQSNSREVAAKWLWQEIADLDREIRERVAKIEAFRRQNGLVQGATASISSESLTNISQQLAAAEQSKAQAQARLDAIRDMRNDQDMSSSAMALDNRTVADIKQQMAAIGNQLAASSTVLGPRHPQRRMLEASLGLLQRQLDAEIDRISASAQKDYDTAVNLVASLEQQVAAAKDNAANALTDESSIEGMVRDVEAKRQLYTQLYQRASELESERRSLNGGARLVSLAEKPTKPYFPKKTPMVAAGFALGLFLAAAACLVWDRFRGSMKAPASEEEVPEAAAPVVASAPPPAAAMPLQLIGTLPPLAASGLSEAGEGNVLSLLRRSMLGVGFQQGVRHLANDLLPLGADRPLLVLPCDSHLKDAGFLTLAVAQALTKSGLNVLVVECAPAQASLAEAFDLPPAQPGFAEVMTGAAEAAASVSRTSIPGLHVVTGSVADLDLLARGELDGYGSLMAWAEPYDLVLFSGPALFDRQSRRALRALSALGMNVVVCLNRPDRLEEAGRLAGELGLNAAGAVLMPQIGREDRRADPFARQRRKIA